MAELDMKSVGNYLMLGAGAVAVPALVGNFAMLQPILTNQLMAFQIYGGITSGGIILASLGVGLVDQLLKR